VRLTRASGDYGVDLLAEKDWITWAFQCKCYDGPVGIKAVQEIYSGRDFYHCHVGVVMTNSIFTSAAENLAQSHNILLWDGDFLQTLAGEER
jgi:restriction system protein